MKKALITGINGQDGRYLTCYLVGKRYKVGGVARKKIALGSSVKLFRCDLSSAKSVFRLLKNFRPDEIYHLAAHHHSSEEKIALNDLDVFKKSFETNVLSTANLLEGMQRFCPKAKFFFAGSSHMFGATKSRRQDERTPFEPDCFYGITKYAAMKLCRYYREKHNLFAAVGILYNHESPLRKSKFISKRIVETAVAIKRGQKKDLRIGDLEAEVDWGYAGDYVEAMHKILQLKRPADFVISSGKKYKVKYFIKEVFSRLGLDWKKYVKVDKGLIRKNKKSCLFGNSRKLAAATGWRPRVNLKEMISMMVQDALGDE